MTILSTYLQMYENTEIPVIYTRWAFHAGVSAVLKHNIHLPFSSTKIYPNLYIMLMGAPGARKSTPVNFLKKHLLEANYDLFSFGKGKNDEFLEHLAGKLKEDVDYKLFGIEEEFSSDLFVCESEANDFFGYHNYPLLNTLTSLWDFVGKFHCSTAKHSKLLITDPCISLLCANTTVALHESFGTQLFGQGLLSRIILVHSDLRMDRYAFPDPPNPFEIDEVVSFFKELSTRYSSKQIKIDPHALALLKKIYKNNYKVEDVRFSGYNNRRFAQLLKLCLNHVAIRLAEEIVEEDVVYANTILYHAEQFMPRALGELGRTKASEVNQAVLSFIYSSDREVNASEILANCKGAVTSIEDVAKICRMFMDTRQIQSGKHGFSPIRELVRFPETDEFDYSLLTPHERMMHK